MTLLEFFKQELEQEAATSRKMLARIPAKHLDWRPHAKSWTLSQLAMHIAEIPGWIESVLDHPELDFATAEYQPPTVQTPDDISNHFELSMQRAQASLNSASERQLDEPWTMRTGDIVHISSNKRDMVRHCLSQEIHHRAQLGVYLRLLDVPIPGSYGPSADETSF